MTEETTHNESGGPALTNGVEQSEGQGGDAQKPAQPSPLADPKPVDQQPEVPPADQPPKQSAPQETNGHPSMPRYRCHRSVEAAEIVEVDAEDGSGSVRLTLANGSVASVDKEFMDTYRPRSGDYFVVSERSLAASIPATIFTAVFTLEGVIP